jgi:hypothetical protein
MIVLAYVLMGASAAIAWRVAFRGRSDWAQCGAIGLFWPLTIAMVIAIFITACIATFAKAWGHVFVEQEDRS